MKQTLSWIDYFLFIFMLLVSTGIGIYYGIYKKQHSANDYLLGSKKMSVTPIALSLITSSLSGVTLLSLPADIYAYGISLMIISPLHIIILLIACYVYIPVFYKLQVTNIYEYFRFRFDNRMKRFALLLFVLHMILLLPILVYIPALAFSQVSGFSIHYIAPCICGICIFYTTLGGIKAVVWSDALQFIVMFGSLVIIVVFGIINTGGFSIILEKSFTGKRMDISFNYSMTQQNTIWATTIGSFFAFLNHFAVNQTFVQKCLCLPSYKSVKSALLAVTAGMVVIITLSMLSGLIIFAHYFGCDPLKLNSISTYDQLLPKYVMDISNFIPGLSGLFISGLFSASLSALAASLNSMSGIIYQDCMSPFMPKSISEEAVSRYLKLIVIILGLICIILVYVVERLGSLLALALSVSAFTGGPLLGLFTAGMLIPTANSKGAWYGGLTSFGLTAWMVLGSHWYKFIGAVRNPTLPVTADACNSTVVNLINRSFSNITAENQKVVEDLNENSPFILYRISFYYYTMIGACTAIFITTLVSYFTKRDKPLNKNCLAPMVRALLKSNALEYKPMEKECKPVNEA